MWAKLNVDVAYVEVIGEGDVIFASCRYLQNYSSDLEAELAVVVDDMDLTMEWSTLPFILEMDCATAVDMIRVPDRDHSHFAAMVNENKRILSVGKEHALSHVHRG